MFALSPFSGQSPGGVSAQMCLTSVFGMAASPSTACGGSIEGAACSAVDKIAHPLRCDAFIGHRKRKQVAPTI